MTIPSLVALAVSGLLIILLCIGDPKRRRVAGNSVGQSTAFRWSLVVLTLVPGVVLAAMGDAAAFLIWLGGCAVVGWCLTLCFSTGARRRTGRR